MIPDCTGCRKHGWLDLGPGEWGERGRAAACVRPWTNWIYIALPMSFWRKVLFTLPVAVEAWKRLSYGQGSGMSVGGVLLRVVLIAATLERMVAAYTSRHVWWPGSESYAASGRSWPSAGRSGGPDARGRKVPAPGGRLPVAGSAHRPPTSLPQLASPTNLAAPPRVPAPCATHSQDSSRPSGFLPAGRQRQRRQGLCDVVSLGITGEAKGRQGSARERGGDGGGGGDEDTAAIVCRLAAVRSWW